MEQERQTLTITEAARLLGISRATAFRRVEDGTLPGLRRLGGKVFVSRPALMRWLGAEENAAA